MTDARLRAYTVRRAQACEAAMIGDLRLASLLALEMPQQPLAAIEAMRRAIPDVDEALVQSGRYFVGDLHGELIGGVGWSEPDDSWCADGIVDADGRPGARVVSPDAVALRGFFLDPDLGRRAVGANLLAHVEADAARAGHLAAELVAPECAQVIYRSLGYRPIRRLALRDESGHTIPVLQMRRTLPMRLTAAA